MQTCKDCRRKRNETIPADMSGKRLYECIGNGKVFALMPTPQGPVGTFVYPIVDGDDPACAVFSPILGSLVGGGAFKPIPYTEPAPLDGGKIVVGEK